MYLFVHLSRGSILLTTNAPVYKTVTSIQWVSYKYSLIE